MRKYENNNLIGYQPCYEYNIELNENFSLLNGYKFVYSIKVMAAVRFRDISTSIRLVI